MNTKARLAAILNDLPWGACPYDAVASRLLPVRAAARLPENPQTVLVLLFPYLLPDEAYRGTHLSKYCVPRDYHLLCGDWLRERCEVLHTAFPMAHFVPFTDVSPLPEVLCAAKAGLGAVGTNGLLLHETYGSWVFIGEIVTDLSVPTAAQPVRHCADCGACVAACPTGALTARGLVRERCLSAISQKKGELTAEETALLQQYGVVWGCDRCQNACPCNRNAKTTPLRAFHETACPQPPSDTSDRAYHHRRAAFQRNAELVLSENGVPRTGNAD